MNGTVREMAGIFLAAVCLGGAYNALSPLGVKVVPSFSSSERADELKLGTTFDELKLNAAVRNETVTAALVRSGPGTGAQRLIVSMAWAEVKPLLAAGEIVLVDARDAAAFEADRIPGAVSLPLRMFDEKIAEFSQQYPKTRTVVTYCGSIGCPLGHLLAMRLNAEQGYTDVREMPGGYGEWRAAEAKGGR